MESYNSEDPPFYPVLLFKTSHTPENLTTVFNYQSLGKGKYDCVCVSLRVRVCVHACV